MLPLSVLGWVLIGGLAGWVASKVMKGGGSMGLLLNIVVGVFGGLIGGFLLSLIGVNVDEGTWILSFLTCLGGACLLLWLMNVINAKQNR